MSGAGHSAIVVGGSVGGLFAANLLLRAGWDVSVYERVSEELSARGAGIVTHPEMFSALTRAGVAARDDIGVKVLSRVTLARDGALVGERALPQVFTSWSQVYRLLRSAFPAQRYFAGWSVTEVGQDATTAYARFANGEERRADLLIGADGIRSTVRQQLFPGCTPEYAGYVAWRGLVEETELSARTHEALFSRFAFCLPPREQILGYPVRGSGGPLEPGTRKYNFVWYRPADEKTELARMLRDDQGRMHEGGIPPHLISRETLESVRRAAQDLLAPAFAEVVLKTEQLFFQPIFDLISERMAERRIVLLGDAAFVVRPHCGMGVTKAGDDAVALVDALTRTADLPSAVRHWERERVAFGRWIVDHARHLGAYMQSQLRTENERRMAERYRTPEAVMRETAVSLTPADRAAIAASIPAGI